MQSAAMDGNSMNDLFAQVSADVVAPVNEVKPVNAKTIQEPSKAETLDSTTSAAELCLDSLVSKLESNSFLVFILGLSSLLKLCDVFFLSFHPFFFFA